jgi:hypothetical protein
MRYSSRLLLIVAFFSTAAHGQSKSVHYVDTSTYVVFKYSEKSDFFFGRSDHFRPTTLSMAEVDDMESLVDSAYQRLVKELPANYQMEKIGLMQRATLFTQMGNTPLMLQKMTG